MTNKVIFPKVSIIIPTYNRAHLIAECLESVLNQTFNDYEVIVVDDGSTDNTKEAVEPYFDRIRYTKQENRGNAGARNSGIELAKGEIIAFTDADCAPSVDWLRNIEEALRIRTGETGDSAL